MSVCIPCAKEIINSKAMAAWQNSHMMASRLEDAVAEQRMTQAVADQIYNLLIAADEAYIEAVEAAEALYVDPSSSGGI